MAKTRTRVSTTKDSKSAVSPVMIGIVAVAAVLLVAGLIWLGNSNQPGVVSVDLSQFPTKGSAEAKVALVEYSDYG